MRDTVKTHNFQQLIYLPGHFLMIVLCCGLTNLSSCFSEPDPADLQLWDRESDPIHQLWFGQPDEVWYQCKDTAVFWQFFPFSSIYLLSLWLVYFIMESWHNIMIFCSVLEKVIPRLGVNSAGKVSVLGNVVTGSTDSNCALSYFF